MQSKCESYFPCSTLQSICRTIYRCRKGATGVLCRVIVLFVHIFQIILLTESGSRGSAMHPLPSGSSSRFRSCSSI